MKIVLGLGTILVLFAVLFSMGIFYIRSTDKGKGTVLAGVIVAIAFMAGITFCWIVLDSLGMIS